MGRIELLVRPARKNGRNFLARLRKLVKGQKQATADHLVWLLNAWNGDWAQYHRRGK